MGARIYNGGFTRLTSSLKPAISDGTLSRREAFERGTRQLDNILDRLTRFPRTDGFDSIGFVGFRFRESVALKAPSSPAFRSVDLRFCSLFAQSTLDLRLHVWLFLGSIVDDCCFKAWIGYGFKNSPLKGLKW
ncbi:hypothetical protein YC2023_032148 [Brassica napus]